MLHGQCTHCESENTVRMQASTHHMNSSQYTLHSKYGGDAWFLYGTAKDTKKLLQKQQNRRKERKKRRKKKRIASISFETELIENKM